MTESKCIIGLTGNIATGKSVVRRMLENCGALGLDADVIAHRMMYPGGPAYQPVIDAFGEEILNENQHISRKKLGQIVFSDPNALARLETLVHPRVDRAIRQQIARSDKPLIAIEAIKLIEAGLDALCDRLWVSHASQSVQMERLLQTRKMSRSEAQTRIESQPPQSEKVARADTNINTEGSFKETWQQIRAGLDDPIKSGSPCPGHALKDNFLGGVDPTALTAFLNSRGNPQVEDLFQWLGTKALFAMAEQGTLQAVIAWDNWNFTAACTDVIPDQRLAEVPDQILQGFEQAALGQHCEILLAQGCLASRSPTGFLKAGFKHLAVPAISHPAWHAAAEQCAGNKNNRIWVKILNQPFELGSME
jgi:dephospho-CoA kinase